MDGRLTSASATWNGEADFTIDAPSSQQWRVQLAYEVAIQKGVEYTMDEAASRRRTPYHWIWQLSGVHISSLPR